MHAVGRRERAQAHDVVFVTFGWFVKVKYDSASHRRSSGRYGFVRKSWEQIN
jgi:hypothetical protein